jgi:hypothetical protein
MQRIAVLQFRKQENANLTKHEIHKTHRITGHYAYLLSLSNSTLLATLPIGTFLVANFVLSNGIGLTAVTPHIVAF